MPAKKSTKKTAKATTKAVEKTTEKETVDISETLRSIKTKFGDESIMTLDETKHVDIDSVSTGSIGLDDVLGLSLIHI